MSEIQPSIRKTLPSALRIGRHAPPWTHSKWPNWLGVGDYNDPKPNNWGCLNPQLSERNSWSYLFSCNELSVALLLCWIVALLANACSFKHVLVPRQAKFARWTSGVPTACGWISLEISHPPHLIACLSVAAIFIALLSDSIDLISLTLSYAGFVWAVGRVSWNVTSCWCSSVCGVTKSLLTEWLIVV
jgi:hypothetical protein